MAEFTTGVHPAFYIAAGLLLLAIILLIVLLSRQRRQQRENEERGSRMNGMLAEHLTREIRDTESRLFMSLGQDQAALQTTLHAQEGAQAARCALLDQRLDAALAGQDARLRHLDEVLNTRLGQHDQRVMEMRNTLFESLTQMRGENAGKLEEMRKTVDENLHQTLSRRLGESFSLVNERLEAVYKGLGEMKTLASGVGDLKRVLTNIKTRGIWGETQLGLLLSEALAPGQYEVNAAVMPNSAERVEYAVKLPGQGDGDKVLLPIDAKFPLEDYERLQAAQDTAEKTQVDAALTALSQAIAREATRIEQKYIKLPYTTDFAILYLPVEGLYAEALRVPGLVEKLQRVNRVVVAGPTTLLALLNSLQMGFKTLAIQERSAEVWHLLSQVKGDFSAFYDVLEKTQNRLRQASESIDLAARKTRTITRRLRAVELYEGSPAQLLPEPGDEEEDTGSGDIDTGGQ